MKRHRLSSICNNKPFTPGDPNLSLMLLSVNLKTLNSDNDVEIWHGYSSTDKNASQSTLSKRPRYNSNFLKGMPGINFMGVDDFMSIPSLFDPSLTDFSVFMMINTVIPAGLVSYFSQKDGTGTGRSWLKKKLTSDLLTTNLGGPNIHGLVVTLDENALFSLTNESGNLKLSKNGVLNATASVTIESANGDNLIGINKNETSAPLDGSMGAVIVYKKLVSEAHRSYIKKWISRFYRVALEA